MAKDVQVTREGYEKLKAELEFLRGPERMRVAETIREAKSHGDLKENAAYHEAKLNQQRLDGRISDLEKAVQRATIVERVESDGDTAQLGSKVLLLDLEFDDELTITLVGSFEADPAQGHVSLGSPFGEALVGKTVGDVIEVEAPGGVTNYKVLQVS